MVDSAAAHNASRRQAAICRVVRGGVAVGSRVGTGKVGVSATMSFFLP